MRQVLTRASTIALLLLGSTACAGGPAIVTPSDAGCAALLPAEWKEGVPGADQPPDQATVADWIAFGDAQTGQLDVANDRTKSAIGIVERCEARDREAVRRATWRRWLGYSEAILPIGAAREVAEATVAAYAEGGARFGV